MENYNIFTLLNFQNSFLKKLKIQVLPPILIFSTSPAESDLYASWATAMTNINVNRKPPHHHRRHRQRPISDQRRIAMKIVEKLRISSHGMTATSTKIFDLEPRLLLQWGIYWRRRRNYWRHRPIYHRWRWLSRSVF